ERVQQEEMDLFTLYRLQNTIHMVQENLTKDGSKLRRPERRDRRTFNLENVQERDAHGDVIGVDGSAVNQLGNRAMNTICPGTYWRTQLMVDQIKNGTLLLDQNAKKIHFASFLKYAETCGKKTKLYRL